MSCIRSMRKPAARIKGKHADDGARHVLVDDKLSGAIDAVEADVGDGE